MYTSCLTLTRPVPDDPDGENHEGENMNRCHSAALGLGLLIALTSASGANDGIAARLAAVKDDAYDTDAVIVMDHTEVRVLENGIGESTSHRLLKILKESAIRGQAVQRFSFDPTTNRLELLAVRVHRADGSVEEAPVSDAVESPTAIYTIFWGNREKSIALPRLNVGDAVETRHVKVGFNVAYLSTPEPALEPPMPGHWYDESEFWSSLPIIEKRYTVRTPKDKPIQFGVYNGEVASSMRFEGNDLIYTFEKRDIPPFKREPDMVGAGDVGLKVVLATLGDWIEKSRWFHEKNEHAFAVTPEIRAKTEEIVARCSTDAEKITALNHWVAENVRYVGTSRGACEGYTTHDAAETFRDRGGVCKDKAGLLVAMLRAAGFESYIVMTQARAEVFPIPADQFNHAVTCVRGADGQLQLLDPTWMPKSRDNWSAMEAEQPVVYGVPEGLDLARAPYFPPEYNHAKWEAQSEISANGQLAARLAFTASGAPETMLRRRLHNRREGDYTLTAEDMLARFGPQAVMRSARLMSATDYSGPIKVDFDFTAEGYALGDGERRYFKLPAMNRLIEEAMNDVSGSQNSETRKYPVHLRATRLLTFEETIKLPPGWSVIEAPQAAQLDGAAASFRLEVEPTPGLLRYRVELAAKTHRIKPDDYAQYREAVKAFYKLLDQYVICQVEATSARR